eukprot:jgi/Mesvir1/8637/Mv02584-RA.1
MATVAPNPDALERCSHCELLVPPQNLELHLVHCLRECVRCDVCGDMVLRKKATGHWEEKHATVTCSQCGESMQRGEADTHGRDACLYRLLDCLYCAAPTLAFELAEHEQHCGGRTEWCADCQRYVLLREWVAGHAATHEGPGGAGARSQANEPVGRTRDRPAGARHSDGTVDGDPCQDACNRPHSRPQSGRTSGRPSSRAPSASAGSSASSEGRSRGHDWRVALGIVGALGVVAGSLVWTMSGREGKVQRPAES